MQDTELHSRPPEPESAFYQDLQVTHTHWPRTYPRFFTDSTLFCLHTGCPKFTTRGLGSKETSYQFPWRSVNALSPVQIEQVNGYPHFPWVIWSKLLISLSFHFVFKGIFIFKKSLFWAELGNTDVGHQSTKVKGMKSGLSSNTIAAPSVEMLIILLAPVPFLSTLHHYLGSALHTKGTKWLEEGHWYL